MAKEEKTEDIEEIQTKMMSEYFRSKAREHKKLKKVMDKVEKNKKSVVETVRLRIATEVVIIHMVSASTVPASNVPDR